MQGIYCCSMWKNKCFGWYNTLYFEIIDKAKDKFYLKFEEVLYVNLKNLT